MGEDIAAKIDRDESLKADKAIMDGVMPEIDDTTCWVGMAHLGIDENSREQQRPTSFPIARLLLHKDVPKPPGTSYPWPKKLVFSTAIMFANGNQAKTFNIYMPERPDAPFLSVPRDESQDEFIRVATAASCWVFEFWTPSALYRAIVIRDEVVHTMEFPMDPDMFEAQARGDNDIGPMADIRRQEDAS
jgi:hypothetical protein